MSAISDRIVFLNEPKPTESTGLVILEGGVIKESLSSRVAIPYPVRLLDSSLTVMGYPQGCINTVYRTAVKSKDDGLGLEKALKSSAEKFLEKAEKGAIACIPPDQSEELFFSFRHLGKGTFNTVSAAILPNGSLVAASVPLTKASSPVLKKPEEVEHLEALRGCPNIIQLIGYENGNCYFEIAKSTLDKWIKKVDPGMPLFSIMLGILEGGVQLAEHGVIHLDLKPENILIVGENNTPKIADFGLVSRADKHGYAIDSINKGNLFHLSPERFAKLWSARSKDRPVGVQDNVWGFMIILCTIAAAKESKLPDLNLSLGFKERYEEYSNAVDKIDEYADQTARETLAKKGLPETYFQDYYFQAFGKGILDLFGSLDDNLFNDLKPRTGLDFIVMEMAMFHPSDRITISEARGVMNAIDKHPETIAHLVEKEGVLLEITQEVIHLGKEIATLKAYLADPYSNEVQTVDEAKIQIVAVKKKLERLKQRRTRLIEEGVRLERNKTALIDKLKA